MRTHKIKLAVLLLALVNFGMSAQLIQLVTLQDGSAVEANHALVKNDTCTFISNEKVDWEFKLFENNRRDTIIVLEASDTDTFCIPVIREKLNCSTSAVDRIASENDSLEYLVGEVRVVNKDYIEELFPIMLDVLPVKPRIESITWDTITLDPEFHDRINEMAHIKIFCKSRDDKAIRLSQFYAAFGDYFGGESFIRWNEIENFRQDRYEQEGDYITFDYWLDWCCYIKVWVTNEFGGIYSAPALVNDYITDTDVLDVIEEYKYYLSGIDSNKNDENDISVSVSGNRIEITDTDGELMAVRLVDSTGRILDSQGATTSIDILYYPAGMYIVVCRTKDNRIVSHKFIKR